MTSQNEKRFFQHFFNNFFLFLLKGTGVEDHYLKTSFIYWRDAYSRLKHFSFLSRWYWKLTFLKFLSISFNWYEFNIFLYVLGMCVRVILAGHFSTIFIVIKFIFKIFTFSRENSNRKGKNIFLSLNIIIVTFFYSLMAF